MADQRHLGMGANGANLIYCQTVSLIHEQQTNLTLFSYSKYISGSKGGKDNYSDATIGTLKDLSIELFL